MKTVKQIIFEIFIDKNDQITTIIVLNF